MQVFTFILVSKRSTWYTIFIKNQYKFAQTQYSTFLAISGLKLFYFALIGCVFTSWAYIVSNKLSSFVSTITAAI